MKEVWADIVGYEGCYMVSNLGNVKSLSRLKGGGVCGYYMTKEKILKQIKTPYGYLVVGLCKNAISDQIFIHRLVAQAFVSNGFKKQFVNHINGIKTDNNFKNLEWVTHSENARHAAETGLYKKMFGAKNPMYGRFGSKNVNSKTVNQIDSQTGVVIKKFNSIADAERELGVRGSNISLVCSGRRNFCGGYKWSYCE